MRIDLVGKWQLIKVIAGDSRSARADIDVACYLLDRLDTKGEAYPSYEAIAKATGQTVRNAQRCIKRLTGQSQDPGFKGYKYFECQPGGGRRRSNTYRPVTTVTKTPKPTATSPASLTVTSGSENSDICVVKTTKSASPDIITEIPFEYSRKESPARSSSRTYGFEGRVIRITESDLERWRNAFHAIPDIVAELSMIDSKLSDDQHQGNWFGKVSAWLRHRHDQLLRAPVAVRRRGLVETSLDVIEELHHPSTPWST